jgi:hypothetical protein
VSPTISQAQDNSPAPFLQWFDTSYATMQQRMTDVHAAGYGAIWIPPPGRADSGDQSVGYDVYDRFDLGTASRPTLYGTETEIKTVANTIHRAGLNFHIDAVINHNGFSDASTPGFIESGGYPGFLIQDGDGSGGPFGVPGTDGDFHSSFESGDLNGRLSGLIDINHGTDFRYIRSPVPGFGPVAGDHGGNLPAGTNEQFGRLANVPDDNNRRFYPDRDGTYISVFNPVTGQSDIRIYSFDTDDPMAGDPVSENATGYLMRYLQWMVQEVGVDGFRIDAAKHFEPNLFDSIDQAIYRSNPRPMLDGSTNDVFSYSEVFDGNRGVLQSYVKKTINSNDPGTVGGNRDALDFAQFFALKANLGGNGASNDWRNVVNAGMDVFDDGAHNGSAGVLFAGSHDEPAPYLSNVAHAYTLMQPGNAVVYMNGKEFGDGRDFPKDGRGDALGGLYGDTIKNLVEIRNSHGRGNYIERLLSQNEYAFEREGSMLVLLSNRNDGGFDTRNIDVNLGYGTHLVELTGNAAAWNTQSGNNDISEVVTVTDSGIGTQTYLEDARFLRNDGQDTGYLVYGLQPPQSDLGVELTNVDSTLSGGTPVNNNYSNGVTRLEDLHVIKGNSFQVRLRTKAVDLLGSIRDQNADGDNALLKIDGGIDANENGGVDLVTPGSVSYGFEQFTTFHEPGFFQPDGNGDYRQTVDTTQLAEGTHFITVRAFRRRVDGGPAVFSDFNKYVYVDRLLPESGIAGFDPYASAPSVLENRDLIIQSLDKTADSVHVLWNLPSTVSNSFILNNMVGGNNQASRYDIDLFKFGINGVQHGNNVATVVTFEETGTVNVQRIAGIFAETNIGAGPGDINFDGVFDANDVANAPRAFESLLYQQNAIFNSAADINGDGLIDTYDLLELGDVYMTEADAATFELWDEVKQRRADFDLSGGAADAADLAILDSKFGTTNMLWRFDLDVNGIIDQADHDFFVSNWMAAVLLGDVNMDGTVNFLDITPFIAVVSSGGYQAEADIDQNGVVDFLDISPFIAVISGS